MPHDQWWSHPIKTILIQELNPNNKYMERALIKMEMKFIYSVFRLLLKYFTKRSFLFYFISVSHYEYFDRNISPKGGKSCSLHVWRYFFIQHQRKWNQNVILNGFGWVETERQCWKSPPPGKPIEHFFLEPIHCSYYNIMTLWHSIMWIGQAIKYEYQVWRGDANDVQSTGLNAVHKSS